jgi:hypothetical protein
MSFYAKKKKARRKLIEMGGRPPDDAGILFGKKMLSGPLSVKLSKDNPSA